MKKRKKEEKNWVMIESSGYGPRSSLYEDQISLLFRKKLTRRYPDGLIKGNLKIGNSVVKKLGWQEKDMMGVFHDKDNEMDFMVTRIGSDNGICLKKVSKVSNYFTIDFNWEGKSSPDCKPYKSNKPLKFKMDKKCIYFEYKD